MYLEQECERRWKARETTRLSSIRDSIALSRKRMKWSTHAIVHKIYGISSACDDPRTLPRASSNIRSCRARARISIYQYIIGVHPSIYMSIPKPCFEISTRSSRFVIVAHPLLAALASPSSKNGHIVFKHNSPHVEQQ